MTDRFVSVPGSAWGTHTESLSDGDDFDIDPVDSPSNAIEVVNIAHSGDCDVTLVRTTDSGEVTITLDSLTGEAVSQGNEIVISDDAQTQLRITNTSGSDIDVICTGWEVSQ